MGSCVKTSEANTLTIIIYRKNNCLKKTFIMAPQTSSSQVISTFNMVGPSLLPKIDMSNIKIDPYLLTNILKNVKGHRGNRKMIPELNTTQVRSLKTCVKRSRNSKENELAQKKKKKKKKKGSQKKKKKKKKS